jgi:hypothetical protein
MPARRRQALIAFVVLAGCGKGDLAITGTGTGELQQIEPYPALGRVSLPPALAALELEGIEEHARALAGDLWVDSDTDRPGYRPLPKVRNVGARVGMVWGYPYVALHFPDDVRERATAAWQRPASCTSGTSTPSMVSMWLDPASRIRAWTAGGEQRTMFVSAYTPIATLLVDPRELPLGKQALLGAPRELLERAYGRHLERAGQDRATLDLPPTEWGGAHPLRIAIVFEDDRVARLSFELATKCHPSVRDDYLALFARAWGEPTRDVRKLTYRSRGAKIVVETDRDQRTFDVRINL